MARDFEKELKSLRSTVQDAERKKVQLETRKEEATNRKGELEKEAHDMGVNPAEIDEHITKLETEIGTILDKVKAHLPQVEDDEDDAAF